jgi:hypothetical protein
MDLDQNFVDEWLPQAKGVTYLGTPLSKMNRDELLAICAWVSQNVSELGKIAQEFGCLNR